MFRWTHPAALSERMLGSVGCGRSLSAPRSLSEGADRGPWWRPHPYGSPAPETASRRRPPRLVLARTRARRMHRSGYPPTGQLRRQNRWRARSQRWTECSPSRLVFSMATGERPRRRSSAVRLSDGPLGDHPHTGRCCRFEHRAMGVGEHVDGSQSSAPRTCE